VLVVLAQNLGGRTSLRLKLGCRRSSGAVGTIALVQIGQNVGGLRQNEISILEDRHIVLSGYLVNLPAHPSAVGYDDSVIGQPQISQFLTDHMAIRAPIDMEKRHSHNSIRLPGNGEKWNAHFDKVLNSPPASFSLRFEVREADGCDSGKRLERLG